MTIKTVAISISAGLSDGTIPTNSTVKFTLTGADIDSVTGDVIVPDTTTVHLDANGNGTAHKWPNARGTQATQYLVTVEVPDGTYRIVKAVTVPDSDCDLYTLLNFATVPPNPVTALAQLAAPSGSSLVGTQQAGPGSVTRTVQAKAREWVSLDDKGVDGGGAVDDTGKILNAIASLPNGGVIRGTPGCTYLVSNLPLTDGIILDLQGATLKASANNVPIISATSKSGIGVRHAAFNGNKAAVTGNLAGAIQLTGCSRVALADLAFSNVRRICVDLGNTSDVAMRNLSAAGVGIDGVSIGMLACVQNGSARVHAKNLSIAASAGVGVLGQLCSDLTIDGFQSVNMATDNGITVQQGTNVALKNLTISGSAGTAVEINACHSVALQNLNLNNNGLYGLMLSVYTGGAEAPSVGVSVNGLRAAGNTGTGGFQHRIIGTQFSTIAGWNSDETLNITNSAGGVATKHLDVRDSYIKYLTIASGNFLSFARVEGDTANINGGANIDFSDCSIANIVPGGGVYTVRDSLHVPITGKFTGMLANGASLDLHVPTNAGAPFNGLLIVGSYFNIAPVGQNSSAVYHVSQWGGTQVAELSALNGAVAARKVGVSVPADNTIRLTNATGVDCIVTAAFFGATA